MSQAVDLKAPRNEGQVTNGAEATVEASRPYTATVKVTGVADIIFHRWNCEEVEEKAKAKKGSKAKKEDNPETYVWRNAQGELCIPGDYLRASLATAARFKQDPRSPRKSMVDLVKAGIMNLTPLASLGTKDWNYLDKRRMTVQRSAITRLRPALLAGWTAEFQLLITLPEFFPPEVLHGLLSYAGTFCGMADSRPTYGRFRIDGFSVKQDFAG